MEPDFHHWSLFSSGGWVLGEASGQGSVEEDKGLGPSEVT